MVRCHIFLREVKSTPGLDVTEEQRGEPCTRACTQRNPQDAAGLSLSHSLTVCTHVECVPAQLQRQPSAAAGNLKLKDLKDGGGGGGGGEEKRISLVWIRTIEMGQIERKEGGRGGRLSNLV